LFRETKAFYQRSQKLRREAESYILVFGNGKNWQGSAKLSPLSLSPPPSEFVMMKTTVESDQQ
jgi:hypothetical protein